MYLLAIIAYLLMRSCGFLGEIMSDVEEAKRKVKEAEALLRLTEASELLTKHEEALEKYPTRFPPGFSFGWRHRHDPFESYWELTFKPSDGSEASTWEIKGSDNEVSVKAREYAWRTFDFAVSVCTTAGLVFGDEV